MKGFAIQRKDRIVVIGACPEEGFAKSEKELLEACEKYYKENGYEQVIPEGTSFTELEEYTDYYKNKGYSFERLRICTSLWHRWKKSGYRILTKATVSFALILMVRLHPSVS